MALRGHREKLSTADEGANIGNFLALLKLLTEYFLLTANHLQHAKENPGSVSYLSPDIQNEFINLLACTVRDKLLTSIKRSKYFGILLDSTPDLGLREQLSEVIKFVDIDFVTKNVVIRESFLGCSKRKMQQLLKLLLLRNLNRTTYHWQIVDLNVTTTLL